MTLPASALQRSVKWQLTGGDLSFGTSLSGRQQFAAGPSPLWSAEISVILPRATGADLDWEAWVAQRRGRLVPDTITPPASRLHAPFVAADLPFSGDTDLTNADSLVLADPALSLTASAAQFATVIPVTDSTVCRVGKFVWINGYMHRVASVGGGTLEIQPPLRAPAVAGTPILASGTVTMTLAAPDEGAITLEPDLIATATITLLEAQ